MPVLEYVAAFPPKHHFQIPGDPVTYCGEASISTEGGDRLEVALTAEQINAILAIAVNGKVQ